MNAKKRLVVDCNMNIWCQKRKKSMSQTPTRISWRYHDLHDHQERQRRSWHALSSLYQMFYQITNLGFQNSGWYITFPHIYKIQNKEQENSQSFAHISEIFKSKQNHLDHKMIYMSSTLTITKTHTLSAKEKFNLNFLPLLVPDGYYHSS